MKKIIFLYFFILLIIPLSCRTEMENTNEEYIADVDHAKVVSVATSGDDGAYHFQVMVLSPDVDCDQYADWWEVVTEGGELIYRRILAHSHSDEQPFVRSGGPMNISTEQTVIIRAHMNNSGYGTQVFKGSVVNGFSEYTVDIDFASQLASEEPQPGDCAF